MENRTRELANLLPYIVRDKLRHYLDYVHDRFTDIALEEGKLTQVKNIRNEIDLIFLLRLLYGYFSVGYRNYDQMLRFFENKQISGFQIGRAAFTRQSSVTLQWQQVADELDNLIDGAGITFYVQPNISVDRILRQIIETLPDNIATDGTTETEETE